MTPADHFARLTDQLPADNDLVRSGSFHATECRLDLGGEPFLLALRGGQLAGFERGKQLMRSSTFTFRATDEAWLEYWKPVPAPGWHDLFALTKRGTASMEGDLRPLLQNLQYFKDLLALPRRLPERA